MKEPSPPCVNNKLKLWRKKIERRSNSPAVAKEKFKAKREESGNTLRVAEKQKSDRKVLSRFCS